MRRRSRAGCTLRHGGRHSVWPCTSQRRVQFQPQPFDGLAVACAACRDALPRDWRPDCAKGSLKRASGSPRASLKRASNRARSGRVSARRPRLPAGAEGELLLQSRRAWHSARTSLRRPPGPDRHSWGTLVWPQERGLATVARPRACLSAIFIFHHYAPRRAFSAARDHFRLFSILPLPFRRAPVMPERRGCPAAPSGRLQVAPLVRAAR